MTLEKFKQVLELIWGICAILFAIVAIPLMISFDVEGMYYLFCVALLGFGIYEIYKYSKNRGSATKTKFQKDAMQTSQDRQDSNEDGSGANNQNK